MLRLIVRLTTVAVVASLPFPIHAQAPRVSEHVAAWAAKSWRASWEDRQGPETTEKINKAFKVGPSGTIDITNVSGTIIVNEGGTDTIVVDAVKRVRSRNVDVRDQMRRTEVTFDERGGRVEVRTRYDGRNLRTSVDYTVTAPAGTTVYAHSISGDIRITNIRGEVRADAVSGDVTAVATPGATLVRTVSGDVSVSGVSNPNELRGSSVSGNVTVNGAKVRSVDVDSISGDVHLVEVVCERAIGKSISGDITFGGMLAKGGRYEFKSQSGDIRLTLVGTTGFEVDANTFSGDVRSDLPVTVRPGEPVGGRGLRKGIHGVNGDGSAQLRLTSFSGSIVIAKK